MFLILFFFFLHIGVLPTAKVFTLIMASFIAASTAVIMSALGVNDRQEFYIKITSKGMKSQTLDKIKNLVPDINSFSALANKKICQSLTLP